MDSQRIQQQLQKALNPTHLEVVGEDGAHFEAVIVSPLFEGRSRIARHQLVYQALGDWMQTGQVHALSLKTYTEQEWTA